MLIPCREFFDYHRVNRLVITDARNKRTAMHICAFAAAHPRFRYVPCLSRELPAPGSAQAHPDVRHGYVQQHLGEFAPDAARDIAYLCGNPDMVDACFEALKGFGLPVPQIRREKYVSSK